MFVLILFSLLTFSLFVHFSLYSYLLKLMRIIRPIPYYQSTPTEAHEPIPCTFIIATYNEEELIYQKLENCFSLQHTPNYFHVLVTDGGSSDKTLDVIQSYAQAHPEHSVEILNSPQGGKINQLNFAYQKVKHQEGLIIVSDADAIIKTPRAIQIVHSLFKNNTDIGLVGGWTMPGEKASHFEMAYWDKQNRQQYLEALSYSASKVVAPFYAFYKKDFHGFANDCVADDIFISHWFLTRGKRILYTPEIDVIEVRQPQTLWDLTKHKFRKANAYSIELFRTFYLIPHMRKRVKFYYTFKLFQFFYLPWVVIGHILITLFYLMNLEWVPLIYSFSFLLITTAIASFLQAPPPSKARGGLRPISVLFTLIIFSVITGVLIFNFLAYPFYRQNSSYQRYQ